MSKRSPSLVPLVSLMIAVQMLIPIDAWFLGIPAEIRLVVGITAVLLFLIYLMRESREHRWRFLALGIPLGILALAPVHTDLGLGHVSVLGLAFLAVLVIPTVMLRGRGIITFKFFPDRLDRIDLFYTVISIFLAWGAFEWYFGVLSPEVPFNWTLPIGEPDEGEAFKLFMGINGVGIWDELFFINICFAIIRSMYGFRVSNVAQAVIYTSVLCDMAFTGWGPMFVGFLAITQGFMYERSKVLIWVLMVHLIVDFFLFQAIVSRYYPTLDVWWHP